MTDTRIHHLPERLNRLQWLGLVVGIVGIAIGLVGAIFQRTQFFNAWLFAYFFVIGIPLGGLALTMLHHMTGGNWGLAIRRECEAAAMTLPLMAVLFIPIALGTAHLFPWANPELAKTDKILQFQYKVYFNTTLFIIRAIICFACWIVLATMLCRESLEYEATENRRLVRRMRRVSAGGLLLVVITITLASFDWVMSREMHFYSTIMGIMIAVGFALSALVFVIVLLRILTEAPDLRAFLNGDVLNDLGNLILTLVILWAYMSFSQLLIIWMGNINHETPWYIHRGFGQTFSAWKLLALFLLIFHFFVPFLILLWRQAKRSLYFLTTIALLVLVMRALDALWLIAPSGPDVPHGRSNLNWMHLPLLLGIFGFWFAAFVASLRRRPLVARVELDEEEAAEAMSRRAREGGAGASPVA